MPKNMDVIAPIQLGRVTMIHVRRLMNGVVDAKKCLGFLEKNVWFHQRCSSRLASRSFLDSRSRSRSVASRHVFRRGRIGCISRLLGGQLGK